MICGSVVGCAVVVVVVDGGGVVVGDGGPRLRTAIGVVSGWFKVVKTSCKRVFECLDLL